MGEARADARVRTCLWMSGRGEEAAAFYVGLLPGSRVERVLRPFPDMPTVLIDFTLDGAPFQILQHPSDIALNHAASISVLARGQAEVDRLWAALAEGGREQQCGWVQDRFGLAWQIVPDVVPAMLASADEAARGRYLKAMAGMIKLDAAALEAAFAGKAE